MSYFEKAIFAAIQPHELSTVKKFSDQLLKAVSAIGACTKLLGDFVLDDDAGFGIPEKIKTNYIRSGLIDAVLIAADSAAEAGEYFASHACMAEKQTEQEDDQ
jgi:hypothetical protein